MRSGQPLRQDKIAGRFGVSKIPVREALVQLRAEKLVTFHPNRGAFVSELSAAEAEEIYFMRTALETAVLKRAIPDLTVGQLQKAAGILNEMDKEKEVARWAELNWDFHASLYSPACPPLLLETIQNLHTNIARYLLLYLAGMDYQRVSQVEHHELLEACRHGNIEQAVSILETHLRAASDELVAFLSSKSSPKARKEKKR
jgi:DNA-binding GntR family transcriptional regulator